jgi:hypothetical protein
MHWPVSVFQSSEGLSWAYLREGFVLGFFSPLTHNGPAIKQVAEGNLPEGRSDRRERSFIACWALLNGA